MPMNDKTPTSLSEQLSQIAPRARLSRPLVRLVSQVVLELRSDDPQSLFRRTQKEILRWINGRTGQTLPQSAWDGESFELEDIGVQRAIAVALPDPVYWTARADDSDKNVAQRVWTTEVGLAVRDGGSVLCGARLVCTTRGSDEPYERSLPGFIKQVVSHGDAYLDGRAIDKKPWFVATEAAVDDLVLLLLHEGRRSDVIVFSLPEDSENPKTTAASATNVQMRLLGAAHVVILSGPASYFLSDRVGKEFSVFRQAVRSYRPRFNPLEDQPGEHPLALAARISNWAGDGPRAYESMLCNATLARTVSVADLEETLPPLSKVRQYASIQRMDAAKEAGSSDKEMMELAMEEIARLSKELDQSRADADSLIAQAAEERDQAIQARNAARAREMAMRHRVSVLEQQLAEERGGELAPEVPGRLDEFEDWCSRHLAGAIEIHSRALQGVKKSEYGDPSFLYKALLLLRDHYVPMRREGGQELKSRYEAALRGLGIEETSTMAKNRVGEEGATYYVRYGGMPRLLDRHLKAGNSRDPRYCFRLYFFWDEDDEIVVVGWLPSHLENRLT